MKSVHTLATSLFLVGMAHLLPAPQVAAVATASAAEVCPAFLSQEYRKLHSSDTVNLCTFVAGKPMLIVNTASHCGYTPQFKGLEAVHQRYKARGLVVLGFSSDDFNQEANDEAEAATMCFINYGVTFTMLAPQHVTGPQANAVFAELARQTREPQWNFNKYLVTADGKVVQYFDSGVEPESRQFNEAVEKLLK